MDEAAAPFNAAIVGAKEPPMSEREIHILSHLVSDETAAIERAVPGARFHKIPQQGPLPEGLRGEVCLTFAWGSPNIGEIVERGVRWVHTIGTGVDRFPLAALDGQMLSCSRGVSAVPISEWALGMMLAFEKDLPGSWIHEPPERWNWATLGCLQGKTLGLIGFGGIARGIAERASAFGMNIVAHRRSTTASDVEGVELLRDPLELAARSDHLVVAASATPATRHIVGKELLANIKRGAHLVNIARGSLVDQDALRDALDDGRVALASLDVCDPEPLPEDHWLYTHPRVRLSPHVSWSMPDAIPQLYASFESNLRRYLAGEPLEGAVDLERGY
jgi:phosphoglycerate dehydrogenase-like enzyme